MIVVSSFNFYPSCSHRKTRLNNFQEVEGRPNISVQEDGFDKGTGDFAADMV